jgi:hypothetical protein
LRGPGTYNIVSKLWMMRTKRPSKIAAILVAIHAVVLSISCATRVKLYQPKPPISPGKYRAAVIQELSDPKLVQNYETLPQATPEDRAKKVAHRNRILREYVWLIDQNYDHFEARYYGAQAGVNWAGDVITIGLTGVASVTGTADLKSVLSAIATGVTGIKTSYEKNFFDQQTRSAIVQKMRALRAEQLALLEDENHMKAGLSEYDLQSGINDVNRYYDAGTVIAALQSIAESAGTQTTKAQEKQKENGKQIQRLQ